jgi:hypothetical protein
VRYAYTVAQIRALEEAAMAVVGDDALMQRAAHGLAVRSADLLASTRGTVYGARVVILVGPGNNGGDALYAGQRLARRGCAVTAVRTLGRPHEATETMALYQADVYVTFKPKREWRDGSLDALIERMDSALTEIPGLDYEFSAPMRMRLDEVIRGVNPFLITYVAILALFTLFPQIVTAPLVWLR